MPTKLTGAEKAAREARIVQMRRARATWDAIAKREGLAPSRCHQIYSEALTKNPLSAIQVDEHRLEETELIDLAIAQLMRIGLNAEVSHRTRVESWNALRGWAERKAKLLGLDAPTQVQVVTLDHLDAQIAALEAELAGRGPVGEAASAPRAGG